MAKKAITLAGKCSKGNNREVTLADGPQAGQIILSPASALPFPVWQTLCIKSMTYGVHGGKEHGPDGDYINFRVRDGLEILRKGVDVFQALCADLNSSLVLRGEPALQQV